MSNGAAGRSDRRASASPWDRGGAGPAVAGGTRLGARVRSVGLGLVLTIGAMGVGAGAAQGDAAPPSGPHARGLEAYRTNYCGACHVLAVAGTAGTFGPSHDGMAATAAECLRDPAYGGAAATPAEYLRESIVDPAAFLAPGYVHSAHAMPAFLHLPDEDLDALVTLLLAQ